VKRAFFASITFIRAQHTMNLNDFVVFLRSPAEPASFAH